MPQCPTCITFCPSLPLTAQFYSFLHLPPKNWIVCMRSGLRRFWGLLLITLTGSSLRPSCHPHSRWRDDRARSAHRIAPCVSQHYATIQLLQRNYRIPSETAMHCPSGSTQLLGPSIGTRWLWPWKPFSASCDHLWAKSVLTRFPSLTSILALPQDHTFILWYKQQDCF